MIMKPILTAATILLTVGSACGSGEDASETTDAVSSVPSETSPPDTVEQLPETVVDSEVVDGRLVVDFSTVEETRSMLSIVSDEAGNRVGVFVTRNDDGAVGKYLSSDSTDEFSVNDGELSGSTDTFDLTDLPAGSYTSCVDLVGKDMRACTAFTTP